MIGRTGPNISLRAFQLALALHCTIECSLSHQRVIVLDASYKRGFDEFCLFIRGTPEHNLSLRAIK